MARVMIVDDALLMRRIIRNILTSAGHEVICEVNDGSLALPLYRQHQPDLVTMDVAMPNTDGIQAARQILHEFPDARIVMVSAVNEQHHVVEAIQAGARHFVIKPINADKMIGVVRQVLGDRAA